MKRIRTIFVALVILLVSTVMVSGLASAEPVKPEMSSVILGDGVSGSDLGGVDSGGPPDPPGDDSEGDPDDFWGASDDKGILPPIGALDGDSASLAWPQVLYLMALQALQTMVP